jgi:hypothetical protein
MTATTATPVVPDLPTPGVAALFTPLRLGAMSIPNRGSRRSRRAPSVAHYFKHAARPWRTLDLLLGLALSILGSLLKRRRAVAENPASCSDLLTVALMLDVPSGSSTAEVSVGSRLHQVGP